MKKLKPKNSRQFIVIVVTLMAGFIGVLTLVFSRTAVKTNPPTFKVKVYVKTIKGASPAIGNQDGKVNFDGVLQVIRNWRN